MADFENYVGAVHVLGYQNPDLTMHSAQVRDLYGTEDGLDLQALEADADALSRLASCAGDAVRAEADGVAALADAWKGQAADSAREFLRRHQDSAAAVSAAVHEAAAAFRALRDQLWHAVDAKVDTVAAIDGRCGPQRAEWLAAAHVVLSGGGDRAAASETVDQKVRPFVEGDIGSDWVSAMHASTASVAGAYDTAIAAVKPDRFIAFEVPGYVGPTSPGPQDVSPSFSSPGSAPTQALQPAVAQTVPAAAPTSANPAPSPALASDVPISPTLPASAVSAAPEPPSSSPGLGDLGGAMPAVGAGLSGLGRQLSDGIAGLTGLTGAGRDALSEDDEPDLGDQQDEGDDDEEGDDETDESNDSDHATLDGVIDPADGEPPADPQDLDDDLSKSTTDHPPPPATPPPAPPATATRSDTVPGAVVDRPDAPSASPRPHAVRDCRRRGAAGGGVACGG